MRTREDILQAIENGEIRGITPENPCIVTADGGLFRRSGKRGYEFYSFIERQWLPLLNRNRMLELQRLYPPETE